MRVFNVLVTFNRAAMLRRTLGALAEQRFEHVVLVDNASTDETPGVLAEFADRFQTFRVVRNAINTGGAGGFERAVREFLDCAVPGDYALLHDDDSWPAFDARLLARRLANGEVRHGCFPVIYPDGELNQMNIPGNADLLERPLRYLLSRRLREQRRPRSLAEFDQVQGFDYAGFVGYLIGHREIAEVGVPRATFFIYSDDTTYTYLASRRLGPVSNLHGGELRFIHDCKRSTGRSLLTGRFAAYEVRNKIVFLRIGSPRHHHLLGGIFLLKCLLTAPAQWRIILRSYIDGYRARLPDYLPQGVAP